MPWSVRWNAFSGPSRKGRSWQTFSPQFFPNPDLTLTGISELFLNAVEHGNLAISYELKSQLVRSNTWKDEVNRRLSDPRFRDRAVKVTFTKKNNEYTLQIEDEGEGFNWQDYLHVDTARVTHNHGRGIAMANMMSFDELIYNDRGNQVTAMVHFGQIIFPADFLVPEKFISCYLRKEFL